jgi:hypothetical protein
MQASYRRELTKMMLGEEELRMKAFEQSRYMAWVILTLVSIITAVGFAFSLFLILKASSQRGHQPVSDLEVTLQKIRLTSIQTASLVGLTVYLSSLTFLYLYMQMAMSISETSMTPSVASTLDRVQGPQLVPLTPRQ